MAPLPHDQARGRAARACEYCRIPESYYPGEFVVDHVIARQHGGGVDPANLAYACDRCNLHKGPNIAGLDPDTGAPTRLFHPRRDRWEDHSTWSAHVLAGLTAVGRTTIRVLAINHPVARSVRAALLAEGVFPPLGR